MDSDLAAMGLADHCLAVRTKKFRLAASSNSENDEVAEEDPSHRAKEVSRRDGGPD